MDGSMPATLCLDLPDVRDVIVTGESLAGDPATEPV
jgi:hypothetical protein